MGLILLLYAVSILAFRIFQPEGSENLPQLRKISFSVAKIMVRITFVKICKQKLCTGCS
jgi:hypothetical protein